MNASRFFFWCEPKGFWGPNHVTQLDKEPTHACLPASADLGCERARALADTPSAVCSEAVAAAAAHIRRVAAPPTPRPRARRQPGGRPARSPGRRRLTARRAPLGSAPRPRRKRRGSARGPLFSCTTSGGGCSRSTSPRTSRWSQPSPGLPTSSCCECRRGMYSEQDDKAD